MADPTGVVLGAPETLSMTCDTDLSAKAAYAVNLDIADEQNVDLAADATLFPFPLIDGYDGSSAKKMVTIAVGGCTEVKAGSAIVPGEKLTAAADGRWVPAAAGELYGAIALEIGAANDLIGVLVRQGEDAAGPY